MRNYEGKDNYGHPKSEYINKLHNMDDNQLFEQTEKMIWLSAYAANNPLSDFHWQRNACYDECFARDKIDIYSKAYEKVFKTI